VQRTQRAGGARLFLGEETVRALQHTNTLVRLRFRALACFFTQSRNLRVDGVVDRLRRGRRIMENLYFVLTMAATAAAMFGLFDLIRFISY